MRLALTVLTVWVMMVAPALCQERYTDARNEFSLAIPAGWTARNDGAMPANTVLVVTRQGVGEVQLATALNLPLTGAVDRIHDHLKKQGCKMLKEVPLRISEVPAHLSVWEKGQTAVISCVLVSGNRGFLMLGEIVDDYENAGTQVRQMIDSFRIVRRGAPAPPPSAGTEPPASRPDDSSDFGSDF